jgi:hypothetical protein
LLLDDYVLKSLNVMNQSGSERVGITQAPSLAIPGSTSIVQRIAGAETDLHRILCLGSSSHGAAFWLGSNGLIRRQALEDICEMSAERGYPLKKYIKDRTLVEDIESTIDFLAHGWEIHNLLDPIAFRGTPADYGSLLVQRRRWAGGGLVNLPKYMRCVLSLPDWKSRVPEALLRLHHLGAQAVNLGGLLLPLIFIARAPVKGWWLWIAAPYYALVWKDLCASGYEARDFPRLLALNLLLLSVNVTGTFKAIGRALMAREQIFLRTPKSRQRTAIPTGYALAAMTMPVLVILAAAVDLRHREWSFAILCTFNAILLTYGLVAFLGLRQAAKDVLDAVLPGRGSVPKSAAER